MTEAIELHPYDPDWPAAFERERRLIAPLFGANGRLIEHMGSTAVPGLPAKPIIDIIVLVPDLDTGRAAIPGLELHGYSYWATNPDTSKLFLAKGLPPAPRRTHHLHVYADSGEVGRHLAFRDLLRDDPEARTAYLALKRDLAERFRDDREAYTAHKADFITAAIARRT